MAHKDQPRVIADLASGFDLLTSLTRLDALRRAVEQQMSLGTADLRILCLLSDGRPRTLRQIDEELWLEQSTVNRQVNHAVAAGFVKRSRSEATGAYEFSATAEGVAAFEEDLRAFVGSCDEALSAIGDTDAAAFKKLTERFLAAFEVATPATTAAP